MRYIYIVALACAAFCSVGLAKSVSGDSQYAIRSSPFDYTGKFPFIKSGRLILVLHEGFHGGSLPPAACYYFRSAVEAPRATREREPVLLTDSFEGVTAVVRDQFPAGIAPEFATQVLPKLLVYLFVECNGGFVFTDDYIAGQKQREAEYGPALPGFDEFLATTSAPRAEVSGDKWRVRFYGNLQGPIHFFEFTGTMRPFAIMSCNNTVRWRNDAH